MDIQLINEELLEALRLQAKASDRKRQNFDLRTTPEDNSQRMLNVLEPGTQVPIHRHEETSETCICLKGHLDMIFYEEKADNTFVETYRVPLAPNQGTYGIQIPVATWHTIQVHVPSVIFEAKDGAYAPK